MAYWDHKASSKNHCVKGCGGAGRLGWAGVPADRPRKQQNSLKAWLAPGSAVLMHRPTAPMACVCMVLFLSCWELSSHGMLCCIVM